MAVLQSLPLTTPLFLSHHHSLTKTNLPKLPLRLPRYPLSILACSAPQSLPATEQDILEAIAMSDGDNVKSLPCVRTYENDLARLTIIGAVGFEQALTAAAADGGEAAAAHLSASMSAMVVETVYPGPSDEHSTVSTRLFLPARKVKEKAKKLKGTLTEDILSGTTSKNILALTFRQVVLQYLWNFELVLFRPGTERDMDDLETPREVPSSFTVSSLNEQAISVLAEVVCVLALESAESHFLNSSGKTSNDLFHWFRKPKKIVSKDSSVVLHKLFEDEIIANAKSLLKIFKSKKGDYMPVEARLKYCWWTTSAHSKLEKMGGPEFSNWTNEYVPAYRLQIDTDKLNSVKFEGWKKTAESRWEVLLTHSQMVGLANILDMYFEDPFTLPNKQLSGGVVAKSIDLSINKRSSSLLKMLSIAFASGIFLLIISVLGRLHLPFLHNGRKYLGDSRLLQSSEVDHVKHQPLESSKSG
ncbi:uncharacterized protein LOC132305038 isoform X2 [Cornus florida]|uniref:uncharacterized protein LOC132305038 isoform X2 n=1 Tax=Cornus florida TaxID=4283 RepID=UPI0028A0C02C|nr:uncharacterized protein LOC132305038 isoform X2 [Cornus florida]